MTQRAAAYFLAAALCASPLLASAHSFDERYDLPVPLAYFIAGAAAVVALSFALAVLFARGTPLAAGADEGAMISIGRLPPAAWLGPCAVLCRALSLCLFCLAIAAAFLGSGDPLMNLAPTLIWIIWWIGFSLLVACVGNLWRLLDPWRTLFDALDAIARASGRREGIALKRAYPHALASWPAVLLLLAWAWLELVYPLATVPARVAWAALAWSAFTLSGMVYFGPDIWQRNVDPFAVYFSILGRFAPLAARPVPPIVLIVPATGSPGAAQPALQRLVLRLPGSALLDGGHRDGSGGTTEGTRGTVGFVTAMLATVLFDGLHAGGGWTRIDSMIGYVLPGLIDVNGYFAGTVGMVGLWLVFLAAYWASCLASACLICPAAKVMATSATLAGHYVLTLVPIAVGYNLAHNFSALLIQGQNVIPLLSDPFGRGWNLFGTAQRYPDIGIIDARTIWLVAIAAIVIGHLIAVWLAHRVALREFGVPRRAAFACLPLTVLMIAYTAISLSVMAEPMVRFVAQPVQAVFNMIVKIDN